MKRWIMILGVLVGVAYADVTISTVSYQKVKEGGKVRWVKAKKVVPGTVVRYVNTIHNRNKETAKNLIVVNKIPEHTEYLQSSAVCKGKCVIEFSVDGGKRFAKPSKLYVKDPKTKKRRRARANEYTAIRWKIPSLPAGKKTVVEYRVRLK